MTWIGPRVMMSMGEDHRFLQFFCAKDGRRHTELLHCSLQLFIVNLLLFTGRFERVVIYIQFSLLLCSFLTVVGLIVLRMRRAALCLAPIGSLPTQFLRCYFVSSRHG